jgi:hypothetical protein
LIQPSVIIEDLSVIKQAAIANLQQIKMMQQMKRKFSLIANEEFTEEEYVRYLGINSGILMHHCLYLELMFWLFGRLTALIILCYQRWPRII